MPKRATYGSSGPEASTDPPNTFWWKRFEMMTRAESTSQSAHFNRAMQELPKALASTPRIISQSVDATDWSLMGEMTVE